MDGDLSLSENDDLSKYDVYGKTPPRTKILRKNRERKHKERHSGIEMATSKPVKSKTPLNRRNTVSTMYDELIAKADNSDHEQGPKRSDKRQMKLLRGSERDLKLDIGAARKFNGAHSDIPKTPQPSYQVESCKRFMSLSGRSVPCNKKLSETSKCAASNGDKEAVECPQSRVDFYQTFSLLLRMGGGKEERNPRRALSREETIWQNELKDVIWLELQAYHADRTPTEEDEYLCKAREFVGPLLNDIMTYRFNRQPVKHDDCPGCLSINCISCLDSQNDALRQIEHLTKRLEDAEALFPSTKAFAELYPLYNSAEFVGRVKAISLWYNMTKHQRLKLNILGRLLLLMENKQCQWPLLSDDAASGSSSDSNNSTGSSTVDLYGDSFSAVLREQQNASPYRRYIENVLKTRALNKSLSFLDRLHRYVLRKAQLTLEQPRNDDVFDRVLCETEDEELRRFGCWSPEARDLDLPSYRSTFVFLAGVPLEVIQEYLLMRLEQKPENPSPLSVRQLMRELKEGLKIAACERGRFDKYVKTALAGTNQTLESHEKKLQCFDECVMRVFADYLDYLEQWVLLYHTTFQKNLLEEEYEFSCEITKTVNRGCELLGGKYVKILSCILKRIGERFIKRIEDCLGQIPKDDESALKQMLFCVCRELQSLFNEEREMSLKTMAFCKKIVIQKDFIPDESKIILRDSIIVFKCIIPDAIEKVQGLFEHANMTAFEETDRIALNSRIREILMQVYRFGFEFYREMSDGVPSDARCRLVHSMVHFANLWMRFVTERCERGRGMRPRWAYQGLEFLLTVCEPANTKCLTEEEFEELKRNMDVCISHVIGTTAPSTPDSGFYTSSPRSSIDHMRTTRSRGSSPSPRPTYKSQRTGRKISIEQQSPITDIDSPNFCSYAKRDEKPVIPTVKITLAPKTHQEHVREAVDALEIDLDDRLRRLGLIGKVLACDVDTRSHVRRRNVTFSWQRGIKIGQGRFGKVYTAVNNSTGEMMAVKEVALQRNDNLTIKRVAEEMKILEGIVHRNLVRYYGVEVHKDEMLIFMEFCAEGTLENLVAATESGLPEVLLRRYTFQLVSGIACLHGHGIVHRDVKTANIFLTDEGNCLKIGDFGCAAKIQSHSTMPGELKGFVGTQAYMAPEVFTKNMSEGHGRAADIWSVGCVVVEMSSGKRPWAQFDSNYQIMFKVGMGQSPDPPEGMIDEGLDFLDKCFKHNPKERATAQELLDHNFVKVGDDLVLE